MDISEYQSQDFALVFRRSIDPDESLENDVFLARIEQNRIVADHLMNI